MLQFEIGCYSPLSFFNASWGVRASGVSKSMRAQNPEPIRSVVPVALMQVLSPEPPYSSCPLSEVIKIW